jgi:fucose 4-O-acetylase-like acetyltransferase
VYQNSFVSTKKVGKALQYIGKRTLDIYLIHYFFIPYLPQIRTIISGNNVVLELVIVGGLSLIVIAVCLIVSNILRTSPILAKYLFGAKE